MDFGQNVPGVVAGDGPRLKVREKIGADLLYFRGKFRTKN